MIYFQGFIITSADHVLIINFKRAIHQISWIRAPKRCIQFQTVRLSNKHTYIDFENMIEYIKLRTSRLTAMIHQTRNTVTNSKMFLPKMENNLN